MSKKSDYFKTESGRLANAKAGKKYMAKMKQFVLRLNPETDSDLIDWLDRQPNKNQAMKDACSAKMRNKKAG